MPTSRSGPSVPRRPTTWITASSTSPSAPTPPPGAPAPPGPRPPTPATAAVNVNCLPSVLVDMAASTHAPGGELPGDPDAAIRQLYSHHARALHGYVERFCPDHVLAEAHPYAGQGEHRAER